MKRYIKNSATIIDVEVITYHPILDVDTSDPSVVASVDLEDYKLPSGRVISKEQARITQRMIEDFDSFMETVEDFCEDNCKLVGVYKNASDDHSHYYNYLATDDQGRIIIDYRLRLRISNHEAHSNKQQKHNKKEELNSEILHRLFDEQEIGQLIAYPKQIIVNDERYDSYDDAMDDVIELITNAVEKMKKNEKHRPKKEVPEDLLKREVEDNDY